MNLLANKSFDDMLTQMTDNAEPARDDSVASRDELEQMGVGVKDTEHKRKTCGGQCGAPPKPKK